MKMYNELSIFEHQGDLLKAVQYIEKNKQLYLNDYLRVIFLLLDFLVNKTYSNAEHNFFSDKLNNIYTSAKALYSENNEFRFYIAMMLYISDAYFNGETIDDADCMLRKARMSGNALYEWGAYTIVDNRADYDTEIKYKLSREILNDSKLVNEIRDLGLLGQYLLGFIESTLINCSKLI